MSLVSGSVPLSLILSSVLEDEHWSLLLEYLRLVVLILVETVLKFRELLSDLLDSSSLSFQFLGIHFDVYRPSHHESS